MTRLSIELFVALALLCGASVLASMSLPHAQRLFEVADSNGDSIVTAEEILAMIEKFEGDVADEDHAKYIVKLHKLLARYDSNGNGRIEWPEFAQHYSEGIVATPSTRNKRDEIFSEYPQQLHLSFTNKPQSEMVVMWITSVSAKGSTVEYGTSENNLSASANGTSYTYEAGEFGWSGLIHKVYLSNLSPGTQYYYRVGDASLKVWSGAFSFRTEKLNQTEAKIATFGDMGTVIPLGFEVTQQMIQDDKSTHFDLITHVGDLAYAGVSASWEYEYIWDSWGEQIEPLSNHIPYMTAVGNHEKYFNFTSFKARFQMPGEESGGLGDFYHSWDYAGIHFVSMCTEDYAYSYAPGTRQYQWLQADLARANSNRAKTPWIFILGHRPMYSSDLSTDSGPLQQYIEPLLRQYKVDLAMWGHMHCYERTYPVYNNVPTQRTGNVYYNPQATTHLTIGTSGAFIGEKFAEPAPAWSAKRTGTFDDSYDSYGFGYLHVFNRTHLQFQFKRWIDNTVWDDFWIIKN